MSDVKADRVINEWKKIKKIYRIPEPNQIMVYDRKELKGYQPAGFEDKGKYYILCGSISMLPCVYKEGCSFNIKFGSKTRKIFVTEEKKGLIDELSSAMLKNMSLEWGVVLLMCDKKLIDAKVFKSYSQYGIYSPACYMDKDSLVNETKDSYEVTPESIGWTFCNEESGEVIECIVKTDILTMHNLCYAK